MRFVVNYPEKFAGLVFVVLAHVALLYATWGYKPIAASKEDVTLFVNLINPPHKKEKLIEPPKIEPPRKARLDKPKPIDRPVPLQQLATETPASSHIDYVAPIPEITPVPEAPSIHEANEVASPKPAPPMMMTSELSLACPIRTAPNYPVASRRMAEQGRVVLRVELNEAGKITAVTVKESSGYKRLDEAGVAVIKNWECNAATKDGEAVKAIALQPFDFILN